MPAGSGSVELWLVMWHLRVPADVPIWRESGLRGTCSWRSSPHRVCQSAETFPDQRGTGWWIAATYLGSQAMAVHSSSGNDDATTIRSLFKQVYEHPLGCQGKFGAVQLPALEEDGSCLSELSTGFACEVYEGGLESYHIAVSSKSNDFAALCLFQESSSLGSLQTLDPTCVPVVEVSSASHSDVQVCAQLRAEAYYVCSQPDQALAHRELVTHLVSQHHSHLSRRTEER